MLDIQVQKIPILSLMPYAKNTRIHTDKQIQQIANSIKEFGFNVPILIDEKHSIIAGHGRVLAAQTLDLKKVPCIKIGHLTEAQRRAFMITDNKLTENAEWHEEFLHEELLFLDSLDLDFDLEVTGFDTPELDIILNEEGLDETAELIPKIDKNINATTKIGDLWILGVHKLYCGDSLQASSYAALLKDGRANLIFTDPPYNVPIQGHVCGNGSIKHDDFAMASGEMNKEQFTEFLQKASSLMIEHSSEGSIHYLCMDWRHMEELLQAGGKAGYELKNLCVWAKDNGGMGSLYRSRHELVFVFKNGSAPHINNVQLGKFGRNRTNVWEYAGVNSFNGEMQDLEMHPTVKPTPMVADAIQDCSERRDIVLDPFGGSGTTLIAAEQTARQARLIEIDPHYCDVIIQRWQNLTGEQAIHAGSNEAFTQLEKENNNV